MPFSWEKWFTNSSDLFLLNNQRRKKAYDQPGKSNKVVTHPLLHLFLFFHFFLFCFNLPAPFMINWNRPRILLQGGKTLLDLKIEIKARPISSNLAKGGEFEKYFLGALSEKSAFSIKKRHGRRPIVLRCGFLESEKITCNFISLRILVVRDFAIFSVQNLYDSHVLYWMSGMNERLIRNGLLLRVIHLFVFVG